ncbi:non-specific lipid transfer protein GPI-anchored 8-like isoform X1 [Brassica napus]|uniref:lipid transfer-like protein VAS isoform X1 n=1 Tax=Brassica oleracea var. oleracea TaxID=109376 RepID=UPI0006A71BC1|nr:PREDICTED: lipid transfer-like protein VAS isoform X1 [Brassica oleracea var. oleracea]XP_022559770.2 non-specific lipid transfer protein GPI-anchored 8-like isoform X1 [Brassica napus]
MSISIFLGVSTVLAILYAVQATAIWDQDKAMVQCVAKLTPCRPYVNSEAPPPLWCCHPLKKIVENDATCLCEAFKHPDMLALIHLTQEAALNLISSCGASYDASSCNTDSPSNASTAGSTTTESSSVSTSKNAALAISLLGVSFVSAFTGL